MCACVCACGQCPAHNAKDDRARRTVVQTPVHDGRTRYGRALWCFYAVLQQEGDLPPTPGMETAIGSLSDNTHP